MDKSQKLILDLNLKNIKLMKNVFEYILNTKIQLPAVAIVFISWPVTKLRYPI